MCGGCWEPHAKMNNNRLLVTIAHEHTRRLSLPSPSLPPSLPVVFFLASLSFSLTHTNSAFPVIYEHIEIQFRCSVSLSRSPHSPQRNTDIWVEGHTAHSTLPRWARDLLSAWSLKPREVAICMMCVCMHVWVCVCAQVNHNHGWFFFFFFLLVQYQLELIAADTVNVCRLRQMCGELYWLGCLLKCNRWCSGSKCRHIIILISFASLCFPKSWIFQC